MSSKLETLFKQTADPLMSEFLGESIKRRKRGGTLTEIVDDVIIERDIEVGVGEAGFSVSPQGQRNVQLARFDFPAATEVYAFDEYVVGDSEVWQAVGIQTGEDASRKTVLCKLITPQTGRRPRTQGA